VRVMLAIAWMIFYMVGKSSLLCVALLWLLLLARCFTKPTTKMISQNTSLIDGQLLFLALNCMRDIVCSPGEMNNM